MGLFKSEEQKTCSSCGGKGKIKIKTGKSRPVMDTEYINYMNNANKEWSSPSSYNIKYTDEEKSFKCSNCNGKGKVKRSEEPIKTAAPGKNFGISRLDPPEISSLKKISIEREIGSSQRNLQFMITELVRTNQQYLPIKEAYMIFFEGFNSLSSRNNFSGIAFLNSVCVNFIRKTEALQKLRVDPLNQKSLIFEEISNLMKSKATLLNLKFSSRTVPDLDSPIYSLNFI